VFDSALMVYYILYSFIGMVLWAIRPTRRKKRELAITEMPAQYWKWAALFVVLFTALGGYLILQMGWTTLGYFVYVDAFTTGLSIVAQWMLAKKWFSNWYVWIVADIVDIWLYWTKALPMVAVLVAVYLVQCVFALFNWTRIRRAQEGDEDVLFDNTVENALL
jgi:nicotinamide mononucleotide transporter